MRVEIELLGGYVVRIDGRTVPEAEWRRRHAAALVKLSRWRRAGHCIGSRSSMRCGPTSGLPTPHLGCTRRRITRGVPWATRGGWS